MAITKSAKKAIRSSQRKRVFNLRRSGVMKDSIKEIKKLVSKNDAETAKGLLSKVYKDIDKAAKKGVIKKNTASRKKSRISALIKKASQK